MAKGGGIIEGTVVVLLIPCMGVLFFLPEEAYWPFITKVMLAIASLLGILTAIAAIREGGRGRRVFGAMLKMLPVTSLFVIPMIYVGFVVAVAIVAAILGKYFDTSSDAIGQIVPGWLGIWIGAHIGVCLVATCIGSVMPRKRS